MEQGGAMNANGFKVVLRAAASGNGNREIVVTMITRRVEAMRDHSRNPLVLEEQRDKLLGRLHEGTWDRDCERQMAALFEAPLSELGLERRLVSRPQVNVPIHASA